MGSHLADVWFQVTDLQVVSGSGCTVTTVDGTEYLDFTSGIAVTSTGHCHPQVVAAIQEQAGAVHPRAGRTATATRCSSSSATRLADITPAGIDTFFFANSGAEATEAAVKLAKQATGRPNVIVFQGSFHGRTPPHDGDDDVEDTATAPGYAAAAERRVRRAVPAPVAPRAEPRPTSVERALDAASTTCCCVADRAGRDRGDGHRAGARRGRLHPGARRVPAGPAATICDEHGILFVADEVQSGFGRTGHDVRDRARPASSPTSW